jgi:hypothetical protein
MSEGRILSRQFSHGIEEKHGKHHIPPGFRSKFFNISQVKLLSCMLTLRKNLIKVKQETSIQKWKKGRMNKKNKLTKKRRPSCPLWSSGYRSCHWTHGSRVQTRPRTMGFLRAIKICSTTTFGGEIHTSLPCHFILRNIKETYGLWKRDFVDKIHSHISQSFSCFATRCLSWLLPESCGGWIGIDYTQMRNVCILAVLGTPCAIILRNSNSKGDRKTNKERRAVYVSKPAVCINSALHELL